MLFFCGCDGIATYGTSKCVSYLASALIVAKVGWEDSLHASLPLPRGRCKLIFTFVAVHCQIFVYTHFPLSKLMVSGYKKIWLDSSNQT